MLIEKRNINNSFERKNVETIVWIISILIGIVIFIPIKNALARVEVFKKQSVFVAVIVTLLCVVGMTSIVNSSGLLVPYAAMGVAMFIVIVVKFFKK